jgi:hypothetical protein
MFKRFQIRLGILVVVVMVSNHACAFIQKPAFSQAQPLPKATAFPIEQTVTPGTRTLVIPQAATKTPQPIQLETITPSPTLSVVKITAVHGNLFIRRGPHMAYNPISVLYEGESVTASGRDVLGEWLQIPIPSQPGKTGWISIQTRYSAVNGQVRDLPVIETVDWPVSAHLINCTYHEMLIEPGDILLPSYHEFPDNEKWIYPGIYKVYDLDVAGEPEILTIELREGLNIDILYDGKGHKRKCP